VTDRRKKEIQQKIKETKSKPERKIITQNIIFANEHYKDINAVKNIFKGIISKSGNN